MFTRQAVIRFQSTLIPERDPGAIQTVQQEVEGSLNYAGNAWFIRYEEQAGEGTGPIAVVWKVDPNKALLLRTGEMSMRQEFVQGAKKTGVYETPYGKFQMAVWTTGFQWVRAERSGTVRLDLSYDLDFAGEHSKVSVQIEAVWSD
ncbi:MAG: hypothetical protein JWN30_167 [Bacilli bacterium]|nr:hypothetical protein [Bacilli bacterium]